MKKDEFNQTFITKDNTFDKSTVNIGSHFESTVTNNPSIAEISELIAKARNQVVPDGSQAHSEVVENLQTLERTAQSGDRAGWQKSMDWLMKNAPQLIKIYERLDALFPGLPGGR